MVDGLDGDLGADGLALRVLADEGGVLDEMPPDLVAVGRQESLLDAEDGLSGVRVAGGDELAVGGKEVGECGSSLVVLGNSVPPNMHQSTLATYLSINISRVWLEVIGV